MFERFTERARQVVVLAQDEAREAGHHTINSGHIILGVLREEEGLGARALEKLGVTVFDARTRLLARQPGEEARDGVQIPFTTGAKRSLELALREALSLGHSYIGTEHVLLGTLRCGDSWVETVLGPDLAAENGEKVRQEVLQALGGRPSRRRPDRPSREAKQEETFEALSRTVEAIREVLNRDQAKPSVVLPNFVWAHLMDPRFDRARAHRLVKDGIDAYHDAILAQGGGDLSGPERAAIISQVLVDSPDVED